MNAAPETFNQAGNQRVETQSVDTAVDPDTSGNQVTSTPAPAQAVPSTEVKEFQSPFDENGKAKFVVDGQEIERDWATIQKEYQLAAASRTRFEQAAETKKKAEDAYRKLYEAAQTDPLGLIRVLNPNFNPDQFQRQTQPTGTPGQGTEIDAQGNIIETRLTQMEQQLQQKFERQLQPIVERFQAMQVKEEQALIAKEYEAVSQKYPVLKGTAEKDFLFNQYRAALEKGVDLPNGMEDVAFYVNQQIEEERKATRAPLEQQKQENKRKAPISGRPAAPMKIKEFESLDQVRELARGALNGG